MKELLEFSKVFGVPLVLLILGLFFVRDKLWPFLVKRIELAEEALVTGQEKWSTAVEAFEKAQRQEIVVLERLAAKLEEVRREIRDVSAERRKR